MAKVKKETVRTKGQPQSQVPVKERSASTEDWFLENKNLVIAIGGIIVLAVAGFFGYKYYQNNQNEEAQRQMFQAVYYFEADSLNRALNGDGNNYGFLDIIEEFGGTEAANLSHFYAGASYLQSGEFENAIEYLNSFSSSDLLLQARAYSLTGDAYMELGNFVDAASHYQQAADYEPNQYFTPHYLIKAAIAYEQADDLNAAINAYSQIIDDYKQAAEYQEARKHKARLEGLASS